MPSRNFIQKKTSKSYDDIIAEIRRGISLLKFEEASDGYDAIIAEVETKMRKLEFVQTFKAYLQKEKRTELLLPYEALLLRASERYDAIVAEIRRGMSDVKSQSELEEKIEKLESMQSVKALLQKGKTTKLLKENDELENLRADLQTTYSNLRGYGERMNWASLTEDLQIEILIRLPVKSLRRFKCVQRSWNILFKTPPFENKRRLHNSENGYDVNESINFRSGYPKVRSWAKPKNLVAKMSHVDVVAEIRSGMNYAKRASDLKTEIRFLEEVLICKAELQKELAAKEQKDNAQFQKLRAALQKRIDKVRKQTAESSKEAGEESVEA